MPQKENHQKKIGKIALLLLIGAFSEQRICDQELSLLRQQVFTDFKLDAAGRQQMRVDIEQSVPDPIITDEDTSSAEENVNILVSAKAVVTQDALSTYSYQQQLKMWIFTYMALLPVIGKTHLRPLR